MNKNAVKIALAELHHDIKLMFRITFIVAITILVGALSALLTGVILQTCLGVSVEMAEVIGGIVMGIAGVLTALFLIEYDIAKGAL